YFSDKPCSACKGERLRPESRAVTLGDVGEAPGKSIVAISRMTIDQATQFMAELPLQGSDKVVAAELLKEIGNRLRFLLDVGLGYLTLDRPGPSLSGGESQRIRLASQMGSQRQPASTRPRPAASKTQKVNGAHLARRLRGALCGVPGAGKTPPADRALHRRLPRDFDPSHPAAGTCTASVRKTPIALCSPS